MEVRPSYSVEDRVLLSKRGRRKAALPPARRRSLLWTIAGGIAGSAILLWVMVQLGQASPNAKGKMPPLQAAPAGAQPVSAAMPETIDGGGGSRSSGSSTSVAHGPALEVPREVIEMLDLRKRDLDQREEAVRQNEERLLVVRDEIEKLLTKSEAVEKRIQDAQASARAKSDQQAAEAKAAQAAAQAKAKQEKDRRAQEQNSQLAKIYEAMPSEDAAARLERMPDRKAIEILRLVKSKTAGAILSQVKPDRAAKLTEQLLAQAP